MADSKTIHYRRQLDTSGHVAITGPALDGSPNVSQKNRNPALIILSILPRFARQSGARRFSATRGEFRAKRAVLLDALPLASSLRFSFRSPFCHKINVF